MTARTSVLDDTESIAARAREIREGESAWAQCACDTVVGANGEVIKLHTAICPVHRQCPPPVAEWVAVFERWANARGSR